MSSFIDKKCELLESLGFEINHLDSDVTMAGITFDFSSTPCEPKAIIETALKIALKHGKDVGKFELQNNIKELLDIK